MLHKNEAQRTRRWPGILLIAGILMLVPGINWLNRWIQDGESTRNTTGPFRPGDQTRPVSAGVAETGITELRIEIPAAAAEILQAARDRALAAGVIEQRPEETVEGRVSFGDNSQRARIRLKGDWTDHVDSNRWSLRIELLDGGSLFGMSAFSIQHPKTRGVISEWMIMEAARFEGLLAPRSFYVDAVINGRSTGIYYLEEHFTKELLESQGRRDGPIVKFDEASLWSAWMQYHPGGAAAVPKLAKYGMRFGGSDAKAFNEKSQAQSDAMNERLMRALDKMMEIQNRIVAARDDEALGIQPKAEAARRALAELQGRSVEEIFVAEKVGQQAALMVIFGATHWMHWIQWRFYHDPVLDRLEPVIFDTGAGFGGEAPLTQTLNQSLMRDLLRSTEAYDAFYRALRRYSSPDWLEDFFAAIDEDLARYSEVLSRDLDNLPPARRMRLGIEQMPEDIELRLQARAEQLRKLLAPADPANFFARLLPRDDGPDVIEVEAWANSWVPVQVRGFRFSSGRIQTAASTLVAEDQQLRRPEGYALLPYQGRQVRFQFPVDQRLQDLQSVRALRDAVKDQAEDRGVRLAVDVLYQFPGDTEFRAEPLVLRRETRNSLAGAGRPRTPLLSEALQSQPCLRYDAINDQLHLRKGTWEIGKDLLIPRGLPLHAEPGTVLKFASQAALVSPSALLFTGSQSEPVRLEALDETAGWPGMVVSECAEESVWRHVVVKGAREIQRGGWQTTGGVTFYRAPIDFLNVRIEDALGEDALNVISSTITLKNVTFKGGFSDLFDGDFVTGSVRNCRFELSGQDAIDFSGSNVFIANPVFENIGDKALSIGERTRAEVIGGRVSTASIGIAVKDASHLQVKDMDIEGVEFYALTAYVKKDEYGPSSIEATGLVIGDVGLKPFLVQTGCTVSLDGELQATEELDIEELYRQKILGK
ncbi:MAG: hypothetical protein ACYTG5_03160 [Planctomycetota bacterium]|jgi:hypothetical protein